MSDKISVIIPAYKSQDVILNCLNSVCNQTYKNLEIIVVLKDSGDKTAEIIQKLNDPRIKVIKQNDDSGAGGARNIGLKSAHGDWIGFVETDDVIDLNFYQKLISAATDENIDILCGEIFNKNKPHNHFAPSKIYTTFTEKYNLIKNGATFDKIFKKSLVRKYNLKCSEKIRWEDNIFIFKAFYYAQKIKTVPTAVYYYNIHPFSESYKKSFITQPILHYFLIPYFHLLRFELLFLAMRILLTSSITNDTMSKDISVKAHLKYKIL